MIEREDEVMSKVSADPHEMARWGAVITRRFVELEQPQRELKSAVDPPVFYFPILVSPSASSVVPQLHFNS